MIQMSFINPLSDEGKQIVREKSPDLGRIYDKKEQIIDASNFINSQEKAVNAIIPQSYADIVIKKVEWYIKRKSNSSNLEKKYAFLFNDQITEFDIIAFYILCQATAIKFGPNSRESRAIVELQGHIIEKRLEKLHKRDRLEIVDKIMNDLIVQDKIKWTKLSDLISSKKINLHDLVLKDGNVVLDFEDFIEYFGEEIKHRQPERLYELFIGNWIKELIITKIIMQNTEDYIKSVYKMSNTVEPNPTLLKIAESISKELSKEVRFYRGTAVSGSAKASPLNVDLFPPCVKDALNGIKSGGRNEVIVLFLTPFLSYARLNPSVFGSNTTLKVSDVDPNLDITRDEILPLVYDAADRCSPPLFDDQPQEKVNINAKLGFGMHNELSLQHEGETKWYTPMSCDKVKMNMPALCKPDKLCKKLNEINPLFYYTYQINNDGSLIGNQIQKKPQVDNP